MMIADIFCPFRADTPNWTKVERLLESNRTNANSRLQLTTTKMGVVWFDQVSVMPLDTYKVYIVMIVVLLGKTLQCQV